jgi:CO/xanthine dehydrogenase Mo-binding subunit
VGRRCARTILVILRRREAAVSKDDGHGPGRSSFEARRACTSRGKIDHPSFLDYRMPVYSDLPMLDTVMVEIPTQNIGKA